MTEYFLIEALSRFVRQALDAQRLETAPKNTDRPSGSLFVNPEDKQVTEEQKSLSGVQIFSGFLPPKQAEEDNLPFVYIRPVSGTVDSGRTSVTVVITVGVYADDFQGYKDATNVYRRISSALTSMTSNRLEGKYERADQLTWEWNQESGYMSRTDPFWCVDITTTWYVYTDAAKLEEFL